MKKLGIGRQKLLLKKYGSMTLLGMADTLDRALKEVEQLVGKCRECDGCGSYDEYDIPTGAMLSRRCSTCDEARAILKEKRKARITPAPSSSDTDATQ